MESKKKSINVEELSKQYEEAKKNFESIGAQLQLAKKEEEDRRNAQLALEKENRKKEVDEAFQNYNNLLKAYINDYGSYGTTLYADDYNWFPNKFWRSFF